MTRLHLIRHGESNWNAEGRIQGQAESVLTDLGRQQAQQLGAELQGLGIGKVFCSSSLRTRQTAAILFADRADTIAYLDDLREINLTPWEGRLYREIEVLHPELLHSFRNLPEQFKLAGAETFAELQARGLAAVTAITTACRGEEIAIVSHGALIRALLCHYEGRPLSALWAPPRMHNCAHSIVEFDRADVPKVIQYAGLRDWR